MASSAAAGLGTGLGTLFAALGRQKVRAANAELAKAKWDQQGRIADSTIGKNDAAAALDRDQLAGLGGILDAARGLGYTDAQSQAISTYARANGGANLKSATDAAMALQIPVAGTAAVPQIGDAFQRALGRDTTKVADGVAFNPLGDAGHPVTVTPLGQAMIGARDAQAAASRAQAGASDARAGLYRTQTQAGGWNPRTGSGGGRASSARFTYPDAPDAAAYLGDAQNAEAFTAWRSQHPEYTDGNQAWIAFRSARPIGSPTGAPVNDDGVAPVYDAPGSLDLSQIGSLLAGVGDQAASVPDKKTTAPTPGVTEDGWVFKGGDPSNPANWVKAEDVFGGAR